jgi:hypothetical protein
VDTMTSRVATTSACAVNLIRSVKRVGRSRSGGRRVARA